MLELSLAFVLMHAHWWRHYRAVLGRRYVARLVLLRMAHWILGVIREGLVLDELWEGALLVHDVFLLDDILLVRALGRHQNLGR